MIMRAEGHILSYLLQIQEEHLSVTGESMFTEFWLTSLRSKSAQEKCGYRNNFKYWDRYV